MSLLMLALMQAEMTAHAEARVSSADAVLSAALHARYPAVVRWEIHALGEAAPADSGAVSVVRLGSRSAVRAGAHLYWYTVSGYGPAVHATRAVSAGESLEATAGEVAETDVLAVACDPLTDPESLRNTRARHALRMDQVLCREAIEPRPAVARGDDVTVRYLGERVSITAKATAQSDGAFGQQVLVKSVGSERLFPAVVSGEREVAIHE